MFMYKQHIPAGETGVQDGIRAKLQGQEELEAEGE